MGLERTGRRIRRESLALENAIKKAIKEEIEKKSVIVKRRLCVSKDYSYSDYERFMKWLNSYPARRRIEIGLLLDILADLEIDYKTVFDTAKKRRSYG